jgi:hypothetical protein
MANLFKRRAFILGSLGIAGLVGWRYRVLQVDSFMAAAGLRRLLAADLTPEQDFIDPPRNRPSGLAPNISRERLRHPAE